MRWWLLMVLAFALACGDDGGEGETDGGVDAAVDAFRRAPDLGPLCELSCEPGDRCCLVDGRPTCIDPRSDPRNCGSCGFDCLTGRGTVCESGLCRCGGSSMGCIGDDVTVCCPATAERTRDYCASLDVDERDCGACGVECSVAVGDRCVGGACICGVSRSGCEGTMASTCCAESATSIACRDLRTDYFHCGGCGARCETGEVCAAGECTVGATVCEEGCPDGRMCCDGVCCRRAACHGGVCLGADAGADVDGGV